MWNDIRGEWIYKKEDHVLIGYAAIMLNYHSRFNQSRAKEHVSTSKPVVIARAMQNNIFLAPTDCAKVVLSDLFFIIEYVML